MQIDSESGRTQDVRQSARAHLIALRQARLAKRGHVAQTEPVSAASLPVEKSFQENAQDLEDQIESGAGVESAPIDVPTDDSRSGLQPSELEPDSTEQSEDLAIQRTATAEMSKAERQHVDPMDEDRAPETVEALPAEDADPAPDTQSPTEIAQSADMHPEESPAEVMRDPGTPADEVSTGSVQNPDEDEPEMQPNQSLVNDWTQSDLARLPGAGPGLIWMLQQCDVFDLADLAAESDAALSERLGVVGQILDVSQWIKFAKGEIPSDDSHTEQA